jgi:hypothetical protein
MAPPMMMMMVSSCASAAPAKTRAAIAALDMFWIDRSPWF